MNVYDQGDLVRVSGLFYTTASALIDPTTVYLIYNRVYNSVTANAVTAEYPGDVDRLGAGVYSYTITASAPGRYNYHWAGSGAAVGATGHAFSVRTPGV